MKLDKNTILPAVFLGGIAALIAAVVLGLLGYAALATWFGVIGGAIIIFIVGMIAHWFNNWNGL